MVGMIIFLTFFISQSASNPLNLRLIFWAWQAINPIADHIKILFFADKEFFDAKLGHFTINGFLSM